MQYAILSFSEHKRRNLQKYTIHALIHTTAVNSDQHQALKKYAKVSQNDPMQHVPYIPSFLVVYDMIWWKQTEIELIYWKSWPWLLVFRIYTKISVYCLHGVYPDWNFGCQMTVRLSKTVSSFTLFLDYVSANTCKNNVNEHHNILSSKFCKTQNVSLPILLATTIDVNCIIIGSHECTVEHKRPTSVSGF